MWNITTVLLVYMFTYVNTINCKPITDYGDHFRQTTSLHKNFWKLNITQQLASVTIVYCLSQQQIVNLPEAHCLQQPILMLLIIVNFLYSPPPSHLTVLWGFSVSFFPVKVFFFHYSLCLFFCPITCLLYCAQSLEKWQLEKLNQSFNKAQTAVGFDKWGG